uniref:Secreted protein n=1 Tax=Setaria viridis TaxID=4556 RepID=A0A4U6W8Y3_SETVI|nr:hypothetical protein SEVIR_1G095801v2 [Setaria viridis]
MLLWSLWHAMEWTTALQLQLVQWTCNAWGWEVATLMEQSQLSHRGDCCRSHSAMGEGNQGQGGGGHPHLTFLQPKPQPFLISTHTQEDM